MNDFPYLLFVKSVNPIRQTTWLVTLILDSVKTVLNLTSLNMGIVAMVFRKTRVTELDHASLEGRPYLHACRDRSCVMPVLFLILRDARIFYRRQFICSGQFCMLFVVRRCFFLLLLFFFFKIDFPKRLFQGYHQGIKQFGKSYQ